jgi:hypothetical protein
MGAVWMKAREGDMTISDATLDEFGSGETVTWSEALAGVVQVALIVAAIAGAVALVSGWLGFGFDGADLVSALGRAP